MLFPRGAKGLNRSMKQYAQIIPIDAQFAADFVAILLFKKYNAKKVPLFRRQLLQHLLYHAPVFLIDDCRQNIGGMIGRIGRFGVRRPVAQFEPGKLP